MASYNRIDKTYNTTRKADPDITRLLGELLSPKTNGHYLDIVCGTGNYRVALQAQNNRMSGIDCSEVMLNEARKKVL